MGIPVLQGRLLNASPALDLGRTGLGPGLDMLASMEKPRSKVLNFMRDREAIVLRGQIPRLDQKELVKLFEQVKQYWDSPVLHAVCLDILHRMNKPTAGVVEHLSLMPHMKDVPLRLKQEVWGRHPDCFFKHFAPLVHNYINQIATVNMHDMDAAKKTVSPSGLTPDKQRMKNKHLTRIVNSVIGTPNDSGRKEIHGYLLRKLFGLVRAEFCRSGGDVRYGALRCDLVSLLKERKQDLVVQSEDKNLHAIIQHLDHARKNGDINKQSLEYVERGISAALNSAFKLKITLGNSSLHKQTLWNTLDVPQIKEDVGPGEAGPLRIQLTGADEYPEFYSRVRNFNLLNGLYKAGENKLVENIAKEFKVDVKWVVKMNEATHAGLEAKAPLKRGTHLRIPTMKHIQQFILAERREEEHKKMQVKLDVQHLEMEAERRSSGSAASVDDDTKPIDSGNLMEILRALVDSDKREHESWDPEGLFTKPVEPLFADRYGRVYGKIITKRMSFGKMVRKLSKDKYPTVATFVQDVNLIFLNCRTYWQSNDTDGIIVTAANFQHTAMTLIHRHLVNCGYYTDSAAGRSPTRMTDERRGLAEAKLRRIYTRFVDNMKSHDTHNFFKVALMWDAPSENPEHLGMRYGELCPKPVWYNKIKDNIRESVIRSKTQLFGAFHTMFDNCIRFNYPGTSAVLEAKRLKAKLKEVYDDTFAEIFEDPSDPASRSNLLMFKVRKAVRKALDDLARRDKFFIFAVPVVVGSKLEPPLYGKFLEERGISNPMDLATVRAKFEGNEYIRIDPSLSNEDVMALGRQVYVDGIAAMRADIQKMFDDSLLYNQYMQNQPSHVQTNAAELKKNAAYAKKLRTATSKIFEKAEHLAATGEELKKIPQGKKGKNGKKRKAGSSNSHVAKRQAVSIAVGSRGTPTAAASSVETSSAVPPRPSSGASLGASSSFSSAASASASSSTSVSSSTSGSSSSSASGAAAPRNVARNITNVNSISDVRQVQKLFVDLAMIMCNPYTTHFLLRCIVSRVRSLSCQIQDGADAWSTNDVLVILGKQPSKDVRLKRLCALLLLGRQAMRLAGEDPDVFLKRTKDAPDEKSMDVRLPIVQVHHKNAQLVPHAEMKALFEESLNHLGQFVRGGPGSSYMIPATVPGAKAVALSPVSVQMLYSLALMAMQNGDYELTTRTVSLITSKCLDSFADFLSADRSQNWLSLYIKSFYIQLKSGSPPNADLSDATVLLLNRIIGKLHHAARNHPRSRAKILWCQLASRIHFIAAWFTRYCLIKLSYFDTRRIHEICLSFIESILPPPDSTSVRFAARAPRLGFGSTSPADLGDMSPPASPGADDVAECAKGLGGPASDSAAGATSVGGAVQTPLDLTKSWWNSNLFKIVRRPYAQVAMPPPRGKGIPELLRAMNVSVQAVANGLQSAQASPLPGSADQAHISPLSTPLDTGTPSVFPSTMSGPSVSPSPLPVNSPLSSSDGASPRSDHASASPNIDGAPLPKRQRLA
jgi:hypothetical protein